mgnify:CR=1 FL=1
MKTNKRKETFGVWLFALIFTVVVSLLLLGINGLIIWGLGLLIINAFHLAITFTYLQAFVIGLVLVVIGLFFK